MRRILLLACLFFLVAPTLQAQFFRTDPAQRFELGQRLRRFEQTLEKQDDKARKRVLAPLEKAVKAFFSGQFGTAASLLDEARHSLGDKPDEATLWAESLMVKPGARLLDPTSGELSLRIESLYKVESKKPDKVTLLFTLAGQSSTVEVKDWPASVNASVKGMKEGDHVLRAEVVVAGKVKAVCEQTVSVANRLDERLKAIAKKVEESKEKASVEKTTLASLSATLRDLAAKKTLETNYPAVRLLKEAEELADAIDLGKKVYGPEKPGQFWLALGSDSVRVQVPKGLKKDKPVPLVVALHGAGGSENMFFDGYGDGKIARLCGERGWLLVATRAGLFPLGDSLDVVRVVDALAKVYPVDVKKVFVVGHSMGASQAMGAVGRKPDRFAAIAALGGGGAFRSSEELKSVACLVGCGDRDFLLQGAKTLHANLKKAAVKKLVYKEYEQVEHLAIVQLALGDVFALFDEVAKR